MIESFYVPSDSMFPTLLIGDHLFVYKLVYGVAGALHDRAAARATASRGAATWWSSSSRATAVAIYAPDRRPDLPTEAFVKRIVGLPGERIELRGGVRVRERRARCRRRRTGETFTDDAGAASSTCWRRPSASAASGSSTTRASRRWTCRPQRVEAGRYFILGDNRDNSNDSRGWGTVRLAEIEGPAVSSTGPGT